MTRNKTNSNPLTLRIGGVLLFLSVVFYFVNLKTVNTYSLIVISGILFFVGAVFFTFGLTKIEIKEDKEYQKYIRLSSKFNLFAIILMILLVIIDAIMNFSSSFLYIILACFAILGVAYAINTWIFYIMTYKAIKKTRSKMTYDQKKKQTKDIIIFIIVFIVLYYIFKYILLK